MYTHLYTYIFSPHPPQARAREAQHIQHQQPKYN